MSVDMPCLKYCIRHIKNEEDQLVFSKMCFAFMRNACLSDDELMGEYAAIMSSARGLSFSTDDTPALNMYQYHNKVLSPSEYLSTVMLDPEVRSFKNCYDYCKQYVPSVSAICTICPYKSPALKDKRGRELSMMKYLCSSVDNMRFFMEVLGGSRKRLFLTGVDMAHDVFYSYPVVVRLNSLLYKYIRNCGESFFDLGDDVKSRLIAHSDRLINLIKSEDTDARQLNEKYGIVISVELNKYIESVSDAKKMSDKEIRKILSPSDKESSSGAKKTSLGKESGIGIIDIFSSMNESLPQATEPPALEDVQPDQEDSGVPVEPASQPENPASINPDGTLGFPELEKNEVSDDTSVRSDQKTEVQSSENQDEIPEGKVLNKAVLPDDKGDSHTISKQQSAPLNADMDQAADENEISSFNINAQDNQFLEQTSTLENKNMSKPSEEEKRAEHAPVIDNIGVQKDPLAMPVINRDVLFMWTEPYSDYDNAAVNAVEKRRLLPLELFSDESDNLYFVIYLPDFPRRLRILLDAIPPSFDRLLSHKEIKKIIWQPYLLYSLCKIKGIPIKGICSILTADILLRPSDNGRTYEKILIRYLSDADPRMLQDTTIKKDLLSSTSLSQKYLIGMSVYRRIYIYQMEKISSIKRMDYLYAIYRDEVLGKSYLRSINLKENSVLFYMDNTGKIQFNTDFNYAVNKEGFIDSFCISPAAESVELVEDFFLRFLADFAARGRFRKYNVQLITMIDGMMVLYIDAFCHEAVTTYIQSYFNRYALKGNYENFELTVEHRRFSPDGEFHIDDRSASELSGSMEDILDILTTSDEILEVKDSHIRGPKGEPFRRQKDTYPKKTD